MHKLRSNTVRRVVASLLFVGGLWAPCAMAADVDGDGRFSTISRDVVRDADTGLQWTVNDNGFSITQRDAVEYCSGLQVAGGGWRLSSVAELQQIYDRSYPGVSCARDGAKCHVSSLFHLTSFAFWSSTASGSGAAWNLTLVDGHRYSVNVSLFGGNRALCVRRS